ncbi:ArsB/NhaD family transporter [Pseudothermotoga elfii]|uniref:SLC13 family permease n=1 Tax=Pseudothermotoga elfii TaxID=38322 RepID=UPI001E42F7A0|nr:SLC13 family permease [Pseudothermotoga elfii]
MVFSQALMLAIFCVSYYFILSGRFKSSVMVFLMGLIVAFMKIVEDMSLENLSQFIDFNTIGLLAGMMIIVGLLKSTGFFQFVAVYAVKMGRGDIRKTLSLIVISIALLSAFLDNVTTILIFAPILLFISDTVGIDAKYLMVTGIIASNLGGASTMIGDPPNIIIGSASKLSFNSFIIHLAPVCILILMLMLFIWFRKMNSDESMREKIKKLATTDPKSAIIDKKKMIALLFVFLGVIFGFALHEVLDYEMALISMAGATIALVIYGKSFEEAAKEVEWDTLFFLIGLFMITYAMRKVGLIDYLTNVISKVHSPIILMTTLIWLSGILAMFLSAVPTVIIMIPVVQTLLLMGFTPVIWWALSLGASLGANGTTIGAAVNIVGVSLLGKYGGGTVRFVSYMKRAAPITLLMLLIANIYVIFIYLTGW